jgi:ABC-type glycerol-3-phosphate transport system substrate-binding protein
MFNGVCSSLPRLRMVALGSMSRLALALCWLVAVWGCQPHSNTLTIAIALLPSELPVYRSVLADFERTTGLRVVVVPQQYADIRRALAAEAFAGRGTLDLVELDVYSLALSAPHVRALDPSDLRPDLDALEPGARRAGELDGLRFLPHRVSWQALVYNHTVLGKAPETWEELLAVARAHPQRIGLKGALYEGLTCDLLPFVWAAGGSGVVLDDAGAIAAFRFFAELAPYLSPQSATFKESTIAEAMARGEIVLHLNWPFVMSLYASQHLAPEPIHSAPLPRGSAGRVTVLGGGYVAVPRSAPHPAAAVRLARYLIGTHAQERLRAELGWFSARRDVAVGDPTGGLEGFADMRNEVRARPERADYPRLSRLWQQAFRAVVFEGADPAATLHAAARAFTEEYP